MFFKLLLLLICAFLCASHPPSKEEVQLLMARIRSAHTNTTLVCPTQQFYEWKKHDLRRTMWAESGIVCGSKAEGCDNPDVRDSFTGNENLTIRVVVSIACQGENGEQCPVGPDGKTPVNADTVQAQLDQLASDYNGTNITFELARDPIFHFNSPYAMLSPYGAGDEWYYELMALKDKYAVEPKTHLNIFVTGQESGPYGILLGIGTFPWDPESITPQGGFWVNARFFGEGQKTAAHELGHNVGLWHTFHGVTEVTDCDDPCFEKPHEFGARDFAYVGDFIETTQATPVNYECSSPKNQVCRITKWETEEIDYQNFMSYADDGCMALFQPQQGNRARCYLCTSLIKGQTTNSDRVCPQ